MPCYSTGSAVTVMIRSLKSGSPRPATPSSNVRVHCGKLPLTCSAGASDWFSAPEMTWALRCVPAAKTAPPHSVRGPVARLGVPPGHYPPPGQCRVWIPGQPPGRQPRPSSCDALDQVPLGAWVLYRPPDHSRILEVTRYHDTRPSVIVSVDYYDTKTGQTAQEPRGHGRGPKRNR